MAGSSRLHDSRLSLVRVHIPLPAVRPRQRSWGTSLPQSVILRCFMFSTLRSDALISRGNPGQGCMAARNGLAFLGTTVIPGLGYARENPLRPFDQCRFIIALTLQTRQRGPEGYRNCQAVCLPPLRHCGTPRFGPWVRTNGRPSHLISPTQAFVTPLALSLIHI